MVWTSTWQLGVESREVRSDVEWFCQMRGTGNWWSRTDCRHCASVTNDDADALQTSAQEKIALLEKTLAGMGDDEPVLVGKRVLEKELEKLQRKLNGPKKTAKPQSAKRNIEGGLRGDQDSPGGRTKTRATSCLWKTQKEIRILEQQELASWRGSASKRLSGWTRDGSAEEIAGWMMEARRLKKEVEAKKRKLQETIEKESGKDARMGDDSVDGLDGSLSS